MTATGNFISVMEASKWRGEAGVVFLDVRTPVEYREVHVGGSRLVPLDELDAAGLVRELAGRRVVVVCRSGGRAGRAAGRLAEAGLTGVVVIEGGMGAWESAGLPVERGAKGMSLERQVRVVAGMLVVLGVGLGTWGRPAFYGLSGLVGAGLIFAGVTDWCGMGLLLARAPWNRVRLEAPMKPQAGGCGVN
ncbi:MAG: rhodanese-like domain-containing protein [Verrucomicrobiales bacterium]